MNKYPLSPTLILYNAKIITLDQQSTIAEAVAIKNGQFIAVGTNTELLKLASEKTKCLDLQQHTIIPGLIDPHFRLMDRATAQKYGANISLSHNIKDILEAIGEAASKIPEGQVITSNAGWYPSMLEENREPTRQELDNAAPNHLVMLRGESEFLYLNSYALKHFNITKDTPQPEYGWIEKDLVTGEPTGILMGGAAELVGHAQVDFSDEQKHEALTWALAETAKAGVTSIREGGVSIDNLRFYHRLYRQGKLPVRFSAQLGLDMSLPTKEILSNLERFSLNYPIGDHWFRVDRAGYFFADDDYNRTNLSTPILNQRVPKDRLHRFNRKRSEGSIDKIELIAMKMAELGLSAGILAGGDTAIDEVLTMLERVHSQFPLADKRWIIAQLFYPKKRHLERMKALGLVLTPMWHHYYYYPALKYYHGDAVAQTMDPFRMLIESGIHVGMGSDVSSIPLNYFSALYYLHTRHSWKWGVVNPEQAVSREQALRLLTINNAYVTFEENVKGSIEIGKLADLVILSEDYMAVPAEKIPQIKPLLTMVEGQISYQDTSKNFYDKNSQPL